MGDRPRRRCGWRPAVAFGLALIAAPAPASADLGRGIQYILAGVLEVPRQTLAGTVGGLPVLGTVLGAVGGAIRGVAMVARGTLELIPVAARLAPLIPIAL